MKSLTKRLCALICAAIWAMTAGGTCAVTLQLSECTRIEDDQFSGDTTLDELILPEGLLSIGARAFAGSSLRKINLPDSLEAIAEDAFDGVALECVRVNAGTWAARWLAAHSIADTVILRTADWEQYAAASHDLIRAFDGSIAPEPGCEGYDSARLLVRIEDDAALPDITAFHPRQIVIDEETHFLIQFNRPSDAKACAEYLVGQPCTLYAEPDGVMSVN